jgi:hypothetical protein
MPMTDALPVAIPPTVEEEERARRVICARAVDAAEAADLLEMLGLL